MRSIELRPRRCPNARAKHAGGWVVETEQHLPSAETALRFSDASSFGNVFGHLPVELRWQARVRVLRRLGEVVGPGGFVQKVRRLIAIGRRR